MAVSVGVRSVSMVTTDDLDDADRRSVATEIRRRIPWASWEHPLPSPSERDEIAEHLARSVIDALRTRGWRARHELDHIKGTLVLAAGGRIEVDHQTGEDGFNLAQDETSDPEGGYFATIYRAWEDGTPEPPLFEC